MADYSLSSCMQHTQGVKQLSGKTKTTWNRSALVEVLCGYQSQHLALRSNSFCFIQFFSSVSAARRIGIPRDLFPNLNIPMKHRQIGGQSVTFTLHKRFSIAIRCLLLRQKKSLISAVDRFFACKWKYWCLSGERRPYKSFSARPIVGLLTLSSHYWSHIHMPVHILVANCRLTVLLVHRISCAILGSQNALIKVGEVLRVWPAVIAILPSLEPQQLSNIGHN